MPKNVLLRHVNPAQSNRTHGSRRSTTAVLVRSLKAVAKTKGAPVAAVAEASTSRDDRPLHPKLEKNPKKANSSSSNSKPKIFQQEARSILSYGLREPPQAFILVDVRRLKGACSFSGGYVDVPIVYFLAL
ncbi:hypothetical protein BDQ17DRAFT_1441610 [Cyathus striatus]|nr:hypothetical protein BDQ17DRAFT_1441610 [Cyathus striatus]